MDVTLPEHVEALRQEVRKFAEREIRPHVMSWDEAKAFPSGVVKQLGEMGMMGVIFPEQYGGAGMGYLEYAVVVEELSRVDGSVGISVAAHNSLCSNHIYAVGDAVEIRDFTSGEAALIPLAGPANRQGRIAAEVILGRDSRYKATQGTAICKVFDLSFAMTGLSEAVLRRKGMAYRRIYVYPPDHATYYPGAHPITLKLLFDPKDGRILGAQAVGVAGVDKRIDVIAVAQRAGLTVFDLEDLELCYAPPFGSAKDPVNMAGFVAANVAREDVLLWEPEELAAMTESQLLLDVRTPAEHAQGSISGAVCLPVDDLRARLGDLPRDRELLVFCQVGLRGYIAARLLSQLGFRVRNLSGGYRRYAMWHGTHTVPLACEAPMQREES